MRRKNTAIVVVLALILFSVLAVMLYLGIPNFKVERLAGTESVDISDRMEALAYMKSAIQNLTFQLLNDFPENPEVTLAIGQFYIECNDPDKAITIFENGLKYNPQSFNLNYVIGQTAFGAGQYEKAAEFAYKALAIDAKNPVVYEDIADALILSGRHQQAVELINEKHQAFGGSSRSYRLLGQGYMLLMNYEKAKEYYEKAFQKDPLLKRIYASNMAKIHMKLKQPEEAKKYLKIHSEVVAENRATELENARMNEYRIIFQSSDSELQEFSRKLVELCVGGARLYTKKRNKGAAQLLLDNTRAIFEKTIAMSHNSATVYREYAMLYIKMKTEYAMAQRLAKKAVDRGETAENYYVLGLAYSENSNPKKAISAYKKALELDPQNQTIRRTYDFLIKKRYK